MDLNIRAEAILLILALIAIVYGFSIYSSCRCNGYKYKKEGFFSFGELSDYNIQRKPINTSSWFNPNLAYDRQHPTDKGIQAIRNRPEQPIPLPEGELSMFANTPFKPECCPNTYSNSTGCACMTIPQYDYLINRGSNNVPYSEY